MQETDTRAAETSFCLPPDGGTLAGAQQREGGGEERHEAAHAAKRVKATRNQFSTIKESIYLTELANWRLTAGAAALGSVRFGFVATRLQLRLWASASSGASSRCKAGIIMRACVVVARLPRECTHNIHFYIQATCT